MLASALLFSALAVESKADPSQFTLIAHIYPRSGIVRPIVGASKFSRSLSGQSLQSQRGHRPSWFSLAPGRLSRQIFDRPAQNQLRIFSAD